MPSVPTSRPARRRALAASVAQAFGGVLSRRLLREIDIDRHAVAREIAADRWESHGLQTIALHTQDLDRTALAWRAVWEVGERIAAVDGVSALHLAGMTGYDDQTVHVSIPHGARVDEVAGVAIHRVQRRDGELVGAGLPRVRTAVATVRAAGWARTDRQAALLIALSAQQRLASSTQLRQAAFTASGRRRRALVKTLVTDVTHGAQSLGELDFARLCRRRGLPPPERQSIRVGPRGRVYLDVEWPSFGVVVEIDGSQHRTGLAVVSDNLRQNDIALTGDVVLRISVIGLRLEADAFMDQVCVALAARGWVHPRAARAGSG